MSRTEGTETGTVVDGTRTSTDPGATKARGETKDLGAIKVPGETRAGVKDRAGGSRATGVVR